MKFFNITFLLIWLKYFFSKYSRYLFIYEQILKNKPNSIMEIGVYRGIRSIEMIKLSNKLNQHRTIFYGFDLFEDITKEKIKHEASKQPLTLSILKKKITSFNGKNKTHLIKGDTKKTLKKFAKTNKKIDFIFVDGGHAVNTIKSDWENIKKIIHKKSIVIFDDYYHDENLSKKYGCKKIIKNLGKRYLSQIIKSNDYAILSNKRIKNSLVKVNIV